MIETRVEDHTIHITGYVFLNWKKKMPNLLAEKLSLHRFHCLRYKLWLTF